MIVITPPPPPRGITIMRMLNLRLAQSLLRNSFLHLATVVLRRSIIQLKDA